MNDDTEVWKNVVGFEGLYQVSNLGRVKSLDRFLVYKNGTRRFYKGRILAPVIDTHGYEMVQLGRKKRKKVHRLVALHFVKNTNPLEYNVINHKDENPRNNKYSNLEWCTQDYNMKYSNIHQKNRNATSIPIIQIDENGTKVNRFSSLCEAARCGLNKRDVWKSLKYGTKYKGCRYEYE